MSGSVLIDIGLSYIREITSRLSGTDIFNLSRIIHLYVNKEMSYEEASTNFQNIIDSSLPIEKLKQIIEVSETPLPDDLFINEEEALQGRKKTRTWATIEDQRLIMGVFKFGIDNWSAISKFVGSGRTRSQCSQRWIRVLDPKISKSLWSAEEESKLLKLVSLYGEKSWTKISSEMGNRSDVQCRYHYKQINPLKSKKHDFHTYTYSHISNNIPPQRLFPIDISIPSNDLLDKQNDNNILLINNSKNNENSNLKNDINLFNQTISSNDKKQIPCECPIQLKGPIDLFKSDSLFENSFWG